MVLRICDEHAHELKYLMEELCRSDFTRLPEPKVAVEKYFIIQMEQFQLLLVPIWHFIALFFIAEITIVDLLNVVHISDIYVFSFALFTICLKLLKCRIHYRMGTEIMIDFLKFIFVSSSQINMPHHLAVTCTLSSEDQISMRVISQICAKSEWLLRLE